MAFIKQGRWKRGRFHRDKVISGKVQKRSKRPRGRTSVRKCKSGSLGKQERKKNYRPKGGAPSGTNKYMNRGWPHKQREEEREKRQRRNTFSEVKSEGEGRSRGDYVAKKHPQMERGKREKARGRMVSKKRKRVNYKKRGKRGNRDRRVKTELWN